METPWKHVHCVGIGGVGMTGLALVLDDLGVRVTGSDAAESANTARLRQRGLTVAIGHRDTCPDAPDPVVHSAAVDDANPELRWAVARGIRTVRRGAFLAELATRWPATVTVAGSHGKTTVTAMLVHILLAAGRRPGYLVGGAPGGGEAPAAAGDGNLLITEVDESDGTQALIDSSIAVVTNVEDDHCWSVGGVDALDRCFRQYAARARQLLTIDSPRTRALFADHPDVSFLDADAEAATLNSIPALAGRHNRINAALAMAAAVRLGEATPAARAAMNAFRGVDRRLSTRYRGPGVTVVEDYAHHPTELDAVLDAVRERHRGRLVTVFQPHRHERVARYAGRFAEALARADRVWVTPTFGAWVADSDRADVRTIVDAAGTAADLVDGRWQEIAATVAEECLNGDLVLVIGAGTISELPPLLAETLKRKGL